MRTLYTNDISSTHHINSKWSIHLIKGENFARIIGKTQKNLENPIWIDARYNNHGGVDLSGNYFEVKEIPKTVKNKVCSLLKKHVENM